MLAAKLQLHPKETSGYRVSRRSLLIKTEMAGNKQGRIDVESLATCNPLCDFSKTKRIPMYVSILIKTSDERLTKFVLAHAHVCKRHVRELLSTSNSAVSQ